MQLPNHVQSALGNDDLSLVSHSPHHLLLSRSQAHDGVCLVGRLGEVAVADLLSFCNMFRKTGILTFSLPVGEKSLYFQEGEVVFATSSLDGEGLGDVLCQQGKLAQEALRQARKRVGNAGLGKFLVAQGLVTAKDLYLAARQQVETIVYNLFAETSGSFYFYARKLDEEQIVRLSMSTQNLVMDGLRRLDEQALYLRRIVSLDRLLKVTDREVKEDQLGTKERRVLHWLQKKSQSSREVLQQGGWSHYDGLKAIYSLVDAKLVQVADDVAGPQPSAEVVDLVRIYNGALGVLSRRLMPVYPDFLQELNRYLDQLPAPYNSILGTLRLDSEGKLPVDPLARQVAVAPVDEQQHLLVDAMNELIYTACVVAKRELSDVEGAEVVRRVQEINQRVRELVERRS
jgi:hypothetical protein